jgi:hypothetical protein
LCADKGKRIAALYAGVLIFSHTINTKCYVLHAQELALVRQHVVLVSSRIVGALSRIKLSDVCAAFVKKLEERVSTRKDLGPGPRSQALKLCAGRNWRRGARRVMRLDTQRCIASVHGCFSSELWVETMWSDDTLVLPLYDVSGDASCAAIICCSCLCCPCFRLLQACTALC